MAEDEVCGHGPRGSVGPTVYEPGVDSRRRNSTCGRVSNDRPVAGERLKTPPGVPDIVGEITEVQWIGRN